MLKKPAAPCLALKFSSGKDWPNLLMEPNPFPEITSPPIKWTHNFIPRWHDVISHSKTDEKPYTVSLGSLALAGQQNNDFRTHMTVKALEDKSKALLQTISSSLILETTWNMKHNQILPWIIKFLITLWKELPRYLWPFTPVVARVLKLSTVLGTSSPNSPMTIRPAFSFPIFISK